jgi:hypothetical protein
MIPCIYGVLTAKNKRMARLLNAEAGNQGQRWGRNAVEMGLHRMAALGMDKKPSGVSGTSSVTPFVTFRVPTVPVPQAQPSSGSEAAPSKRRIGF